MKPPTAFLSILIALVSCSPKAPPAPVQAPVPPGQPTTQADPAPASTPTAPVPVPSTPVVVPVVQVPVVPVRPFDESLLRGREFLLEALTSRKPVKDPDLGILGQNSTVSRVTEAFFRDALDGNLEAKTLVPRWTSYLQAWAKRFASSGKGEGKLVRVGEGLPGEQGLLLVPVRLSGGPKPPLQGWVALAQQDESWLVSDVQVVESVPRTDPFNPEASSQEISSPSLR